MEECSAGLFDLIDIDAKLIKEQRKRLAGELPDTERADALYRIVLSAARMPLVTRGFEASTDAAAFSSFIQHFIQAGLIASIHEESTRRSSTLPCPGTRLRCSDMMRL